MAIPHFTDHELQCRCGCGRLPPPDFQNHLEELRVAYGWPMHLSSCARCSAHNIRVAKTGPFGPHVLGAVDVLIWGLQAYRLLALAIEMGWTGIGVSQIGPIGDRYLHLDRLEEDIGRPRPTIWSYPS